MSIQNFLSPQKAAEYFLDNPIIFFRTLILLILRSKINKISVLKNIMHTPKDHANKLV